jgi:hypothetical protein
VQKGGPTLDRGRGGGAGARGGARSEQAKKAAAIEFHRIGS